MEAIMFAFHKRQQALTIYRLASWQVYRTTYEAVRRDGALRGIRVGMLAIWRMAGEIL
jgi:hypothetical protein